MHPYKMRFFAPRHSYRPSHWLTAIPVLQKELIQLFLADYKEKTKERKLLVMRLLSFLLKQEDYLLRQALKEKRDPEAFVTLRFSWEEKKLLDSLWWGPGRVLRDEELVLVKVGPGAKECHQNLFRENPELHRNLFQIDPDLEH